MATVTDAPVAFITGAGSGLGLALVRLLLARGYRVGVLSRSAPPADLAGEDRLLAVIGEVADATAVRAAVDGTRARWGRIDLAIANAGVREPGAVARLSLADAKRTMEVNYFGMLHLYDACLPALLERRGCFVGIASLAGVRCLPGGAAYGASKAAIRSFLDTARAELRPAGVRVVSVNPWFLHVAGSAPVDSRPFSMPLERAALRIVAGLERGQSSIAFPAPVAWLWCCVRALPDALFDRLFAPPALSGQRWMARIGRWLRQR